MGNADRPIRFGVLLDRERIERWQAACVEKLLAVGGVLPALVILRGADSTERAHASGRAWLFDRLIERSMGRSEDAGARGRVALPVALSAAGVARVELPWHAQGEQSALSAAASSLEFILSFSAGPVPAWLARAPRHGVWIFHWGDWRRYRGESTIFWESFENAHTASAQLLQLSEDDSTVSVLREGCLRIAKPSYRATRERLLSRFTHWPAQVCIDLRGGEPSAPEGELRRSTVAPRRAPGPLDMFGYLLKSVARKVRSAWKDLFIHDHWNVGIVRQPISAWLEASSAPAIEWLPPLRRSEFLADCFGIVRDGRLLLLCEYLDHRSGGRGVIVATEPGADAGLSPVEIGPEPPVHLSYPYLFQADGRTFCIPETHEAREVALYEPEEFPRRWKKIATLLSDIALVDATVFRHADYWWLAGSEVAGKGTNCELHLWYARELTGPWSPHAQNPVKTDVRSARPGGTPFVHQGKLYRPAQDCSASYGGRIVINHVLVLTPQRFKEEVAAIVSPDSNGPYPHGLHTLSAAGDITVLDGKRSVFVRQEFVRVLRWALGAARSVP